MKERWPSQDGVGIAFSITEEYKSQLDATYYFIVLLISSTCFGHYYAHHQELATIMLITTLVVSFCKDWEDSVNVKLWFLVVYVQFLFFSYHNDAQSNKHKMLSVSLQMISVSLLLPAVSILEVGSHYKDILSEAVCSALVYFSVVLHKDAPCRWRCFGLSLYTYTSTATSTRIFSTLS